MGKKVGSPRDRKANKGGKRGTAQWIWGASGRNGRFEKRGFLSCRRPRKQKIAGVHRKSGSSANMRKWAGKRTSEEKILNFTPLAQQRALARREPFHSTTGTEATDSERIARQGGVLSKRNKRGRPIQFSIVEKRGQQKRKKKCGGVSTKEESEERENQKRVSRTRGNETKSK